MSGAAASTRDPTMAGMRANRWSATVGRFAWKEGRELAGLAAGVCAIALLLMAGMRLAAPPRAPWDVWVAVGAWGFAALFAAAGPVVLFAVERERRTTTLLASLPIEPTAMLVGKLLALCAWTTLLLALLMAAGWALAGGAFPAPRHAALIVPQGITAMVEALVWGAFASLLAPGPLAAAVCGVTLAALNAQVAMALAVPQASGFTLGDFQAALPARWALAATVGAVDVRLGWRWLERLRLRDETARAAWLASCTTGPPTCSAAPTAVGGGASSALVGRRREGFLRLLWQSWRESSGTVLGMSAAGLALMFVVEMTLRQLVGGGFAEGFPPMTLLFIPALLGAQTFRRDQLGYSYRFLAERSVSPLLLWLARQVFWLTPTVAWCILVTALVAGFAQRAIMDMLAGVAGMEPPGWTRLPTGEWHASDHLALEHAASQVRAILLLWWCGSITAHALGQFASLAVRSAILTALASLAGAMAVAMACFALLAMQLSPLVFLAPWACGWFVASALSVRGWLHEQPQPARWMCAAAAVLLPLGAALCLAPAARRVQLRDDFQGPLALAAPAPTGGVTAAEQGGADRRLNGRQRPAREIEHDIVDLLRTAYAPEGPLATDVVQASPRTLQLVHDLNRSTAELLAGDATAHDVAAIAASPLQSYPESWKRLWRSANSLLEHSPQASLQLALAARALEQATAEREPPSYPASETLLWNWVRSPYQTAENLRAWLAAADPMDAQGDPLSAAIDRRYRRAVAVVQGREAPSLLAAANGEQSASPRLQDWAKLAALRFPGEAARSVRALDLLSTASKHYVAMVDLRLEDLARRAAEPHDTPGGPTSEFPSYEVESLRRSVSNDAQRNALAFVSAEFANEPENRRNAALLAAAATSYVAAEQFEFDALFGETRHRLQELSLRRAGRIRVALWAFRLEQGALPNDLDELAPAYLSSNQLCDPCTGDPFDWNLTGCELPLLHAETVVAEPHTPILWSAGLPRWKIGRGTRFTAGPSSPEEVDVFDADDEQPILRFVATEPAWDSVPCVLELAADQPSAPEVARASRP